MNNKGIHISLGLLFILGGISILIDEWDPVHGFPVNLITGYSILILGIVLLSYGVIFGVYRKNNEVNIIENMICPKCQDVKTNPKNKNIICQKCNMPLITLDEFLAKDHNKHK